MHKAYACSIIYVYIVNIIDLLSLDASRMHRTRVHS